MRVVGPRNGRAKEGGGARGLISKYWGLKMERGEGRWAGAAGVSVGTSQGRGKEGEAGGRRRGTDKCGLHVSDSRKKKKEGREGGPLREKENGPVGRLGWKGR
jgi:hypothetical protein